MRGQLLLREGALSDISLLKLLEGQIRVLMRSRMVVPYLFVIHLRRHQCAIFLILMSKLIDDTLLHDGHDCLLQHTTALIHTASRLYRRMLLAKPVPKETARRLAIPRRQTLHRKLLLLNWLCDDILRIRCQMGGSMFRRLLLLFVRRKSSVIITAAASLRCENDLGAGSSLRWEII